MIDVSVIIPTFNRLNYLLVALDSVFSQSDVTVECIVVDDCSTDGTVKYIQDRYDKENLRVIAKDRRSGPQSSRNIGVKEASGEFVTFLDSDDFFEPGTLARRLERCRDENLGALFSGYKVKYAGQKWDLIKKVETSIRPCPLDYASALCNFKIAPTSTIIYRRSEFGDLKLDETLVSGHDDDLALQLIRTCKYAFDNIMAVTLLQHLGEHVATPRNLKIGDAQLLQKYAGDILRFHGTAYLTGRRSKVLAELWAVAEFKRSLSLFQENQDHGSIIISIVLGLLRLPSVLWCEFHKRLKIYAVRVFL